MHDLSEDGRLRLVRLPRLIVRLIIYHHPPLQRSLVTNCKPLPRLARPLLEHRLKGLPRPSGYFVAHIRL